MQVISVDISIVPPSYCIEVNGNLRDTEEWRLKNPSTVGVSTATAAPAAAVRLEKKELQSHIQPLDLGSNGVGVGQEIKKENEDFEDFGDFFAAPEPLPPPSPPSVPSFHSSPSHTPRATSSKPRSPPSTGGSHSSRDASIDRSFRKFLAAAAPNVAHVLEEQDALERNHAETEEDDFGEFTDAPVEVFERVEDASLQRATSATMAATDTASAINSAPANDVPLSSFMRTLAHLPTSSTSHTNGTASEAKNSHAVQEYGVVWASILNTGAEKLEAGRLFWKSSHNTSSLIQDAATTGTTNGNINSISLQLLEIPRAQHYFAALGRIYYVASLVRLSAEMLGLLHFVQELESAWTRCSNAWNCSNTSRGIRPLSSVSHEAAKKLGFQYIVDELESLKSVAAVLPTLSLDEFPRMMAWSEGLDSVLLFPLSVITESGIGRKDENEEERKKKEMAVAVVEWPEGSHRRCLSVVANFWLGCVSSIPPDLE